MNYKVQHLHSNFLQTKTLHKTIGISAVPGEMKFICSILPFISLQVCLVQCDTEIFLNKLKALRSDKQITQDQLEYSDSVYTEMLRVLGADESVLLEYLPLPSLGWNELVNLCAEKNYAVLRGNSCRKMNADGTDEKAVFEELSLQLINRKSQKLLYDPAYDKVAIKFYYEAVRNTRFVIIFHVLPIEDYVVRHISFLRAEFMGSQSKDVLEPISNRLLNEIALITTEDVPPAVRSDLIVQKIKFEHRAKNLPTFGIMTTLDDKMVQKSDASKESDTAEEPDSAKKSDSAKESDSAKKTLLMQTARRMGVYVQVVKPTNPAATKTDKPNLEEPKTGELEPAKSQTGEVVHNNCEPGEIQIGQSEGGGHRPDDTQVDESRSHDTEGPQSGPQDAEEDEIGPDYIEGPQSGPQNTEEDESEPDEIEQEEPETDEPEVDTETISAYLVIVIESDPDTFRIVNQVWVDVLTRRIGGEYAPSKTLYNSKETNQQLNEIAERVASTDSGASLTTHLDATACDLDAKRFHGIHKKIKCTVGDYKEGLYNVLSRHVKQMCDYEHDAIVLDKTNIRVGIGFHMYSVNNRGLYSYYWNIVVLFERAKPV